MSELEYEQPQPKGVTRRTVTKAMAWAVPAIAIAAPAPAFAVSGSGPSGEFIDACKQPGASCNKDFGFVKGYTFTIEISNTSGQDLYIYPTNNGTVNPVFALVSNPAKNFSYNTAREYDPSAGGGIGPVLDTAELVPNGGDFQIIVNAGINSNSANISATGGLWMAWGHTLVPGADPDHPYTPAPPPGPGQTNDDIGEGWFFIPISFPDTPPCGTDCAPGGDETDEPV